MSDAPQGPGWWVASDGKWYPPEQAPTAQPPPPQAPPPIPPSPTKGSSGKGCIYALIAVAVLGALGVIGAIFALAFLGDNAVDDLGEALDEDPCPFLANADARDVFGDDVEVVELSGLNQFLELTGDTRVLADAPDCIVRSTAADSATVARVARYQGSDASSVYTTELDVADGLSEQRGQGLSVETDDYLSDQAVEVGDEGFCTTASPLGSSGALVRQGDTVVYVGVQPDFSSETPEVDLEAGGFATDVENCTRAQEAAEKILG